MKNRNSTNFWILLIGASFIFINHLLMVYEDKTTLPIGETRCWCYFFFYLFWAFTLWWRVIQKQTRRCLLCVASLEMFWILVRYMKYYWVKDILVIRYCWYLFYLPMIFIPVFCLLLAISMEKPENYRLNLKLEIFPIMGAVLFLLVMTNDLHQLVFQISGNDMEALRMGNFKYVLGFWIVVVFDAICCFGGLGIIWKKCRVPGKGRTQFLPLIPLGILIAGCILYGMGINNVSRWVKIDLPLFVCVCITLTLEACIQCKLILVNTEYEEIFRLSSIQGVLVDHDNQVLIASDTYQPIEPEIMNQPNMDSILLKEGIRVSSVPTSGGRFLWQEDVSELNKIVKEYRELGEYLQGKNETIQKDYEYRKRERQLVEKNRLYNQMLTQTKPEIEQYAQMVEQLAKEEQPERIKRMVAKIAFICAFIKRRDNLLFLSEEERMIHPDELKHCIGESLTNLSLCGIENYLSSLLTQTISFEVMSYLYETFYQIVYACLEEMSSICVYLIEQNQQPTIVLRIVAQGDMNAFVSEYVNVEQEDDEWVLNLWAPGGGIHEV